LTLWIIFVMMRTLVKWAFNLLKTWLLINGIKLRIKFTRDCSSLFSSNYYCSAFTQLFKFSMIWHLKRNLSLTSWCITQTWFYSWAPCCIFFIWRWFNSLGIREIILNQCGISLIFSRYYYAWVSYFLTFLVLIRFI
jgi:hypothetical protein